MLGKCHFWQVLNFSNKFLLFGRLKKDQTTTVGVPSKRLSRENRSWAVSLCDIDKGGNQT